MSERVAMTCGHCLRQFALLHCGSGESLCCECVHVKRLWLSLERRGVDMHNKYAEESLAEHANGKWCDEARLPNFELPEMRLRKSSVDIATSDVLDAEEIG